MATTQLVGLSMACGFELYGAAIRTRERKAAWHKDCVKPDTCPCPAHKNDASRPAPQGDDEQS